MEFVTIAAVLGVVVLGWTLLRAYTHLTPDTNPSTHRMLMVSQVVCLIVIIAVLEWLN